jgi:nitrate reductase gamma subunit
MEWYYWLVWGALAICLISLLVHFVRLVKLGKPLDYSKKAGDLNAAIKYSYTGAMSPTKKESAYLHLPTYTAGILYHLGTFLSILLFFLLVFNVSIQGWLQWFIIGFLGLSVLSGFGIFIKRIVKQELRALSNPDDYISNLLVTAFQFFTGLVLFKLDFLPIFLVFTSLLLLYLPLGKLKHAIYFFAARYHLGYFFGWRGVWPPQ